VLFCCLYYAMLLLPGTPGVPGSYTPNSHCTPLLHTDVHFWPANFVRYISLYIPAESMPYMVEAG
jgi:hypothetical protein